MKNSALQAALIEALTAQVQSDFSDDQIRQLAREIIQGIENHDELLRLPDAFLQDSLQPAIQVMLAHGHASIADAAQTTIQVLVTRSTEDLGIKVPLEFQNPESCPYPGLKAFAEEDSASFYGREDEIEQFAARLPQRLIAVTGASGVGKSSFIQAGLLPLLRRSCGDSATVVIFRASSSSGFLAEFAGLLSREFGGAAQELNHGLELHDNSLQQFLLPLCTDPHRKFFLIVDQFEEVFIHETIAAQRRRFLDNLLVASSSPELKSLSVILVSRKNFFEHRDYATRSQLVDALEKTAFALDTLTDGQLRHAIEQPLNLFNQVHRQNLHFQSGLVDVIINDFRSHTASLPLVQYLLRLLWIEKHQLSHFAYTALGKLDRVLDRHATDIYERFADSTRPRVEGILLALVGLGLDGEYARKRVRYDELVTGELDEAVVRRLLAPASRVISEQTVNGVEYLELTHEVILREWTVLRSLITANRERLRQREQLLINANLWFESRSISKPHGNSGYLYQGALYRQAKRYIETESRLPGADRRIVECFRTSKESRRRTVLVALTTIAIIAVFVLSILWIQQQRLLYEQQRVLNEQQRADTNATAQVVAQLEASVNATAQAVAEEQARINENARATAAAKADAEQDAKVQQAALALSRRLATVAQSATEDMQIDLALLLSVEAYRASPTAEAKASLFSTLEAYPRLQKYLRHPQLDDAFAPLQFSPDSKTLATGEPDGSVTLWDVRSGKVVRQLQPKQPVSSNDHLPSSARTIVFLDTADVLVNVDKITTLWDLSSARPLEQAQFPGREDLDGENAIMSSGAMAVSASFEYVAQSQPDTRAVEILKRQADGFRAMSTITESGDLFLWDKITALAFSSDGSTLAVALGDTSPSGVSSGHIALWDVKQQQLVTQSVDIFVTSNLRYIDCIAVSSNSVFGAYAPVMEFIATNPGLSPTQYLESQRHNPDEIIADFRFVNRDRFVATKYAGSLQDLAYGSPPIDLFSSGCGLAVSPDGRYFASGNVVLWNLTTSSHLNKALALHPAANLYDTTKTDLFPAVELRFDAEGSSLLAIGMAGRDDGTEYSIAPITQAWDILSGEPSRTQVISDFAGWMGYTDEARLSATDTVVDERQRVQYAALEMPDRLEIRDLATGQLIGEFKDVRARHLILSPDGRYLASFGFPSHSLVPYPAHLTVVDFSAWQEIACEIANRNLTQEEWDRYLPSQPYRSTCAGE